MSPLITLHYLNDSRAHRLAWLLEELELDYEVKHYERRSDGRAPASLKNVHPLGKAPILEVGGEVLCESGAIVDYLLKKFEQDRFKILPDQRQTHRFFMHFAEGSMMPFLLLLLVAAKIQKALPVFGRIVAKNLRKAFEPDLNKQLGFVESTLEGQDWLCQTLSGADIMMSFPLQAAMARSTARQNFPNIQAYIQRIESRPAYQRACTRCGPLTIMS